MTNFNSYPKVYPILPTAPLDPTVSLEPQGSYHLDKIQSKRQELLELEESYKKKHKKYRR